jgi:hypothetical protein
MSRAVTRFWLLILLLSLLPFPSTAQGTAGSPSPAPRAGAPLIRNATVVYYDIAAATTAQLLDQLTALGPVADDGYRGHALTGWMKPWCRSGSP